MKYGLRCLGGPGEAEPKKNYMPCIGTVTSGLLAAKSLLICQLLRVLQERRAASELQTKLLMLFPTLEAFMLRLLPAGTNLWSKLSLYLLITLMPSKDNNS